MAAIASTARNLLVWLLAAALLVLVAVWSLGERDGSAQVSSPTADERATPAVAGEEARASAAPGTSGDPATGLIDRAGTDEHPDAASPGPAAGTVPAIARADADPSVPLQAAGEAAVADDQPVEPAAVVAAWERVAALLATPRRAELAQLSVYDQEIATLVEVVRPRHRLLGIDQDQRQRLAARVRRVDAARWEAVHARAAALGVALERVVDGRPEHLVGFDGERPLYETTTNVNAAISTAASFVRQSSEFGTGVDGGGYGALVFDAGVVRHHEEFRLADGRSRVAMMDPASSHDHADHVAGTIAAAGKNPGIKGMAPATMVRSVLWTDGNLMTLFGQTRPGTDGQVLVSNTSLGSSGAGDGGYTSSDAALDSRIRSLGYFLPFASAGNDGAWYSITGYDKEAKNCMTVASASDLGRDADGNPTSGGGLSGFSSRGPIDDGRIKPDITGNGAGLTSTSGDGTGTSGKSGTSMSSPNCAGSALLIQDYFGERFPGHLLRSHMLKGLICHSADDFDRTGPDYKYGWGYLNVLEACRLIRHYAQHPETRALVEDFLEPDEVLEYRFVWDGSTPIKATLCWIEPPGATHSGSADDRTPDLINDLDLRIIAPDGAAHRPWVMPYVSGGFIDGDQEKAAVRGDNTTDNVEQVVIAAPSVAGEYLVRISHKGNLVEGAAQHFGLCIDGTQAGGVAVPAPSIASIDTSGGSADRTRVGITGSGFLLGAQVLLRSGSTDIPATAVVEVDDELICWFDLAEVASGGYQVVVRNPGGGESTGSFAFQVHDRAILLAEDFEAGFANGWSHAADTGSDDWRLDTAQPIGGGQSAFVPNTAANTLSQLISPTVTVPGDLLDLHLSFRHRYEFRGIDDDACVLEARRDGGTWYDVLDDRNGGVFVEERYDYWYNGSILPESDWQGDGDGNGTDDSSRWAWVFHSQGTKRTTLRLDPVSWAGHDLQFRWRFVGDGAVGGGGWWVDEVVVRATVDGAGNVPPSITSGPVLDPDPVTGQSATLSLTANDGGDGPSALSYSWSVVGKPSGAPDPTFSPNGGSDAGAVTVSFAKAGLYRIRVTVSDGGATTATERDVLVQGTASVLRLDP